MPSGMVVRVRDGNGCEPEGSVWSGPGSSGLVQEKICRNETALDRIHGQTELFKHGETQQDGIPGLPKDHTAWNRFPVNSNRSVANVPLGPMPIREDERNLTELLDPQPLEEFRRDHGQGGTGIRKGRDLLRPRASPRIDHDDTHPHLTHTPNPISRDTRRVKDACLS